MAPLQPSSPLEAPPNANPPLFHIPPGEDYNPAPSRNAVWTVLAVFSFFGICSILLAGWVHFVERADAKAGYHSSRKRRAGCAGGRRIRDWCRSRSNSSSSGSSTASSSEMFVHPNKSLFHNSKRWHQYNQHYRQQQRSDSKYNSQTPLLLGHEYYQEQQRNGYRTFPSFDEEDLEAGPCDCGAPDCAPPKRPTLVRMGKSDGLVPGTKRKERRGMRRSHSSPMRVSGECPPQEDRPQMSWKYNRRRNGGNPRRKSMRSNSGLDVVIEEASTTPER